MKGLQIYPNAAMATAGNSASLSSKNCNRQKFGVAQTDSKLRCGGGDAAKDHVIVQSGLQGKIYELEIVSGAELIHGFDNAVFNKFRCGEENIVVQRQQALGLERREGGLQVAFHTLVGMVAVNIKPVEILVREKAERGGRIAEMDLYGAALYLGIEFGACEGDGFGRNIDEMEFRGRSIGENLFGEDRLINANLGANRIPREIMKHGLAVFK